MNKTEIETKANAIEAVLTQNGIEGRVTGGVVAPRSVQFTLATIAHANKVEALAGDLAAVLGAPEVEVTRQGGHLILSVERTDAQPIRLLPLLARLPKDKPLPACTATLGLCDDGAPLLVRLSKDVGHVLVTGPDGCGKSALLRTMAVSLAVTNRPRDLKLILVGRELGDLAGLPHARGMSPDDVVRLLGRDNPMPRVVVVIDDCPWHKAGGTARLLAEGHESGIRVLAASLPGRSLAGCGVVIEAKGQPGDFEVIASGEVLRFQAAYISPDEIAQVVNGLVSHAPRVTV